MLFPPVGNNRESTLPSGRKFVIIGSRHEGARIFTQAVHKPVDIHVDETLRGPSRWAPGHLQPFRRQNGSPDRRDTCPQPKRPKDAGPPG